MGHYHRRGRGQTFRADELGKRMAIPVLNILMGRAFASFPFSSRAAPAPFVQVNLGSSPVAPDHQRVFPVTCSWRQWNLVIAPLLMDPAFPNYFGSLGAETGDGVITDSPMGEGVWENASPAERVTLLEGEITRRATEAGW